MDPEQAREFGLKTSKWANLIENYIYIYHLGEAGEFVILPTYPDKIQSSQSAQFNQSSPLARSAPIYAYAYSGARTVNISLTLYRDMFDMVNSDVSNLVIGDLNDEDYVETLVNRLSALAVPNYNTSSKMITPPQVAIRIGKDFFIKGVVTSGVTVGYSKPLIEGDKYNVIDIQFTVSEVDPYDATTVAREGNFRGITRALKNGIRKAA